MPATRGKHRPKSARSSKGGWGILGGRQQRQFEALGMKPETYGAAGRRKKKKPAKKRSPKKR